MADGVIFRLHADNRISDIAKCRYLLETNVRIGFFVDANVLSHQLVHRTGEKIAKLYKLVHFRIGSVQFPLGNGLSAHAKFISQLLLRHLVSHLS